jgi:hypothetical protein
MPESQARGSGLPATISDSDSLTATAVELHAWEPAWGICSVTQTIGHGW